MKKNVLNLITIASLCATILHGAVPPAEEPEERMAQEQIQAYQEARGVTFAAPALEIIQEHLRRYRIPKEEPEERMAREQIQAYQEARGGTLAAPVPAIIQEYLKRYRVPINIINNNCKTAEYLIELRDDRSGKRITSILVTAIKFPGQPATPGAEAIDVPLIPLKITVNAYMEYEGYNAAKCPIGSFKLSMQKLSNAKSVAVNSEFAQIQDKNGVTQRQEYFSNALPSTWMPAKAE